MIIQQFDSILKFLKVVIMTQPKKNIPQDSLSSLFKLPVIGKYFCKEILNIYEKRQGGQQVDQYSRHTFYGKLYSALISQSTQNTFPHEQLKLRKQIFPWYQGKGINIHGNNDGDFRPDKKTNKQHFQHILKYLIEKDLPYIGKIYNRIEQKGRKDLIKIEQQKGLGIHPQGEDYLKNNIFFHSLKKKDQIKFLMESIKPIIVLNSHQIDHNDVTFRNYIFSFIDNCFKLIDYDTSYMYKQLKNQILKAYQSQTELSSLRNSNKFQQSQTVYSLIYSNQQITFMSQGNNYQKLRQQNIGKKDTIMYGFMILRLLYHTKEDCYKNITQQIGKLVKMYQKGQFNQNQHILNYILMKNFEHKYIKIVKFILQNMMIRSCRKRPNLSELQAGWIQKVNQILIESQITQNNSNQKVTIQNSSQSLSDQLLNNPQKMFSIFEQNTKSILNFNMLSSIDFKKRSKQQDSLRNTTKNQNSINFNKKNNEIQIQMKNEQEKEQQQKIKEQQSTTMDLQNSKVFILSNGQSKSQKSESQHKSQEVDQVHQLESNQLLNGYIQFPLKIKKKCSEDSNIKNNILLNGSFKFQSNKKSNSSPPQQ